MIDLLKSLAIGLMLVIMFGMAIDLRRMQDSITGDAYRAGFKYGIEVGRQRHMAEIAAARMRK